MSKTTETVKVLDVRETITVCKDAGIETSTSITTLIMMNVKTKKRTRYSCSMDYDKNRPYFNESYVVIGDILELMRVDGVIKDIKFVRMKR